MVSRGYLIRFIDIGLIVMFGFIQISDIESLAQVELEAARGDRPLSDAVGARSRVVVVVAVAPDGRFSVSDAATGVLLARDLPTEVLLTSTLRAARDERAAEGREIVVLIRSSGRVVGQIDIDSDQVAAFSTTDHGFLRMIAGALGSLLPLVPETSGKRDAGASSPKP